MHLLIIASLFAVAAQSDTVHLTLGQALELARRSNPDFLRETLGRDNDHLEWLEARADRFLPVVSIELTTPEYVSAIRRISSDDGSDRFVKTLRRTVEGELQIRQPLPSGGTFSISGSMTSLNQPLADADERFAGATFLGFQISQDVFGINNRNRSYRLAREDYARSQTQFLEAERELAEDIISEYYDLVQAIKEAQIDSMLFVRDSLRIAESQSRPVAQRMSEVDSLKFALEVARSAFNHTRSRQELASQRASFNEVLGLPHNTVVIPDTVVLVERIDVDVPLGLAQARAQRMDLRLAELSVDNRRAGLKDARRTSPITLEIDGRMGFDGSAEALMARSALRSALANQDRSTNIQLSVSIPLFDRFEEKYAVAAATNELRRAEISLEAQLREVENEVRLAAQSVANALTQLALAEQQFQITRRTMQIQTERFARGEIQSTEFLIDQANAREAEVELLEAQVDLLLANEEWKQAIGVPPFAGVEFPGGASAAPNNGRAPGPRPRR